MKSKQLLEVGNVDVSIDRKKILSDISLKVGKGEVHVIMGPNGSGKSTLLYGLMAHPAYAVKSHDPHRPVVISLDGRDVSDLPTEERARQGLFLAMQAPIAIPGVSVVQILRNAKAISTPLESPARNKKIQNAALIPENKPGDMSVADFSRLIKSKADYLKISHDLLSRGIHDGFSGGERKKMEILEALVLQPKLALFDEIDTGLDVDALQIVAHGINELHRTGVAVVLVTHYQRILKYITPDQVHILVKGSIIASGDSTLSEHIDKKGYAEYTEKLSAQ